MSTSPNRTSPPQRASQERAWSRYVYVSFLLLAVFGTDVFARSQGQQISIGILYIMPVFAAQDLRFRRAPLWVGAISAVLMLAAVAISKLLYPMAFDSIDWVMEASRLAICLFGVGMTVGISMWVRAEEQRLEEERRMMRTTLESIADAVITTDHQDRIRYMNPSAANKTGWSPADAQGRPLDEVFREETGNRRVVPVVPEEHGVPHEAELVPRLGKKLPIETTSALIRENNPDALGRRAGRVLVFRDISERKRQQATVERLAYQDMLTGLPNRASFFERLDQELAHARRDQSELGLLFIDLDGFKAINDTYGHRAGDFLLKVVARRLREVLRESDTVARLAGDEFTVILPNLASIDDARLVAQKIMLEIAEPVDIVTTRVRVSASIGIAMYPGDALDRDDLLQRADQAMYRSKSEGGSHVEEWGVKDGTNERFLRRVGGRVTPFTG